MKQGISGAINGFLFGICTDIALFIFFHARSYPRSPDGQIMNSAPQINYFEIPIYCMLIVAVVKIFTCQIFRICNDSIVGWQIIGLFSFIAYIIVTIVDVFLSSNYSYSFKWDKAFSFNNLAQSLLSILIFNFMYSIIMKIVSAKKTNNLT